MTEQTAAPAHAAPDSGLPEGPAAESAAFDAESRATAGRTVKMRRYTLDPDLADEFVSFLHTEVFPAREGRGFAVESAWLAAEKNELTWYVSFPGGPGEFDAAEGEWEDSAERARIFAGRPKYVLGKDVRTVSRLR